MWKLPDGTLIKSPRKGKTFLTNNPTIKGKKVRHQEKNLLIYNDETLTKFGIKKMKRVKGKYIEDK
ncbi:MAG: hypothetical protein GWN62_02310 [Aliifodinibius sp.]|nr:hypothetical protein [Fodinibius sp.]